MDKKNQKSKIKNSVICQRQMTSLFFIICSLFVVFLVSGCVVQKRSCPALATVSEASQILDDYSAGIKPLKATGNCTISYTNAKGEKFAQAFPVRMWYLNSHKFCLYGDVAFNPKGVCFAVNGDEYWAYARPLGVYVKGKINTAGEDYLSNPALLVDFLQPVDSVYDKIVISKNIMFCRASQSGKQKKIFIDTCGKVTKKIEYLNRSEKPVLIIDAGEYKNVKGAEFSFPYKLNYKYFDNKKGSNQMELKLDSVQSWQGKPEQIKALFAEPDANEFEKDKK